MTRILHLTPQVPIPGEGPYPVDVRFSFVETGTVWETAKKLVSAERELGDALIEPVYLTEPEPTPNSYMGWHLAAYVNENGIGLGMIPCARIGEVVLFGPIVFVRERIDHEGESFYADITDEDYKRIKAVLVLFEPAPVPDRPGYFRFKEVTSTEEPS